MENYYIGVNDETFAELKPYLRKLQEIYQFYNKKITFTNRLKDAVKTVDILTVDELTTQKYLIGLYVLINTPDVSGRLQDGKFKLDEVSVLDIRETDFYRSLALSEHLKELRLHEEKILFLFTCILVEAALEYKALVKAFFEGQQEQFIQWLKPYADSKAQEVNSNYIFQILACAIDLAMIKSNVTPLSYFQKAIAIDSAYRSHRNYASYLTIKEDSQLGIPLIQKLIEDTHAKRHTSEYYKLLYDLCVLYVVSNTPQKATPLLRDIYEGDHPFLMMKVKSQELQADIYRDMLAYESSKEAYQAVLKLYGILAQKHPFGDDYVPLFEQAYQKLQNLEMRTIESWR